MKFTLGVFAALAALCAAPGASTTDAFVPRHPGRAFVGGSGSSSSRASTTSSFIEEVATQPIPGMKPGTSGLRKKVEVWQGIDGHKYYVENFIQSLLDAATAKNGGNVPST